MRDKPLCLGTCCACGGTRRVRNILMLRVESPTPGKGWGCCQCGQPSNGAIAVMCDACLERHAQLRFIVVGYPANNERLPFTEVKRRKAFDHDYSKHPEALEEARET